MTRSQRIAVGCLTIFVLVVVFGFTFWWASRPQDIPMEEPRVQQE